MFPIRAKSILPIERIIIQSVAVRGQLGDISIWISNAIPNSNDISNRNNQGSIFRLHSKYWTKVYEKTHKPSQRTYQTMDLTMSETPVFLLPGEVRMMYIHSTLESDTGTLLLFFNFFLTSVLNILERLRCRCTFSQQFPLRTSLSNCL
jgi:hypothetical protein